MAMLSTLSTVTPEAFAAALRAGGVELHADSFFDTLTAVVSGRADAVVSAALDRGVNHLWTTGGLMSAAPLR